jgi:hypothetical protein
MTTSEEWFSMELETSVCIRYTLEYSISSNESRDPASRTPDHHAEQMHVTGNTALKQSNNE